MQLQSFQYLGQPIERRNADGLGLTLTRYPKHQRQPWHVHENPNLFVLLRGDFMDRSRALGDQTLGRLGTVFHPAGELHAGEAGPQGRSGLNIEPTASWLVRYGLRMEDLGHYRVIDSPVIGLAALKLALSIGDDTVAGDLAFEMVLPLLIPVSIPEESAKWFSRLREYVAETDPGDCNLRSAAREVSVHPVYLARVFRRRYGCSLGEYILFRRLVAAGERVLHHGSSLAEAAVEAGFSDQAHLTRLFRRELGRTPRSLLKLRAAVA